MERSRSEPIRSPFWSRACDPFYLPLLRGIEDAASERGTLVLIVDTRDSSSIANAMTRRLVARGVDGIIAVSVGDLPDHQPGHDDTRLPPIVCIGQPTGRGTAFCSMRPPRDMPPRIIWSSTGTLGSASSTAPLRGRSRGTSPRLRAGSGGGWPRPSPALVAEVTEFSIDEGRRRDGSVAGPPRSPTSVLAAGSTLAMGDRSSGKAAGLHVPGRMAIIGYTDSPLSPLLTPPLTMVEVPAREIGVRAVR